jgi:chromosome segregation ATPase
MLITGVTVEGVGRFERLASVRGLGEGVNVLAANNEAGKSTLFRAIRTCLFKRHDSRDQDVRDLGTFNSQLPASVTVTFEQQGKSYEIRKSFLRSVSASLLEDGREVARGRQADEKVCELFGVASGSGRAIDDAAFGVLWVGQGRSTVAPIIAGRADSMLSAMIEEEVGTLVGGDRARTAMSQLGAELARYQTDTGRTKTNGPLDVAEKEYTRLKDNETDLGNRSRLLDEQFTNLALARPEQRRLSDPTEIAVTAGQLADAEAELEKGQASAAIVRTLQGEERVAHAKLETATQRLEQFEDIISRIDSARSQEGILTADLATLIDREQSARNAVEETKTKAASLEQQLTANELQRVAQQGLRDAATKARTRVDLNTRLQVVQDAFNALAALNAQISQIKITPAVFTSIETIDKQQVTLEEQLTAAAPQLSIDVHADGAGRINLGGSAVTGPFSGPLVDLTQIEIAGIATITLTPPFSDAKVAETKRSKLAADLQTALQKAGVETVAEAVAAITLRRDLETKRRGVQAELKALGVQDDNPSALIASLTEQIAEVGLAVQQALQKAGLDTFPDGAGIDAQLASIAASRGALQQQRAALTGARNAEDEVFETAMRARARVEAELIGIRKTLQADLSACPDASRAEDLKQRSDAVHDLRIAHQQSAGALAEQRRLAPDAEELERRENRRERLREQRDNRDHRLQDLKTEIAKLETHIQLAGGDGLGETLGATREQLELASREVTRITKRTAALRLLRTTISAALAEGQERYFEPVRRHLKPFLHDLFPGAELQLAEGFEIAGIKRTQEELFEHLSDGTREQIAILVRLAMGAMLSSRSQNVPIVLDDALVFSDDDRIQRMFDALSRAGRQQQVIVLTCRTKAFEQLGGRSLRIEEAD